MNNLKKFRIFARYEHEKKIRRDAVDETVLRDESAVS